MPFTSDAADKFKLSRSQKLSLARTLSRLVLRFVQDKMDASDFGPNSREGAPNYSTREMWFNIHEPSGRSGAFRAAAGAGQDADYVRLEGGYKEFRQIYRGSGGSRVKIDLTGSVRQAMEPIEKATRNLIEAGIDIANIPDKYSETSAPQRARYVNRMYEFMWLRQEEKDRIKRKFLTRLIRMLKN